MPWTYTCWSCHHSTERSTPIYRSHSCEKCYAPGHACKGCRFYDPNASKQCREPVAEPVSDKEKANFCDYFKPGSGHQAAAEETESARAKLDALFKK